MKKIALLLISFVLMVSCETAMVDKSIRPENITQIGAFEPISLIGYIEKGNQTKFSDSLSDISTKILDSLALTAKWPKVDKKIDVDEKLKKRLEIDILKTVSSAHGAMKKDIVKSTPLMDSLIKGQNQRFGLCIINNGFGRKKGNYGKQIAKSIGVGVLTLGMFTTVPVKNASDLRVLMFDAETGKVNYYHYLSGEVSPTDRKSLSALYKLVFDPLAKSQVEH